MSIYYEIWRRKKIKLIDDYQEIEEREKNISKSKRNQCKDRERDCFITNDITVYPDLIE